MTYEQAYADGFCKAAEVLGVPPEALVKRAQALSRIGALLSRLRTGAKGAGNRYLELLRGGNAEALKPYLDTVKPGATTGSRLRSWLSAITGKGVRGARGEVKALEALGGDGATIPVAEAFLPYANARLGAQLRSASELRKALGARVGTGALAAGGAGLGIGALVGGSDAGQQSASPSALDSAAGFVKAHPLATGAAALGVPLAAYGAYRVAGSSDKKKKSRR